MAPLSQLTDSWKYRKFIIIWNWCTNIPGISPEDFRKIYHPEPRISNSFVNCLHMHARITARTHKCKSRADPTRRWVSLKMPTSKMIISWVTATLQFWLQKHLKTWSFSFPSLYPTFSVLKNLCHLHFTV